LFDHQSFSKEAEHRYNETYPDQLAAEGSRDMCVDYRTLTCEWH